MPIQSISISKRMQSFYSDRDDDFCNLEVQEGSEAVMGEASEDEPMQNDSSLLVSILSDGR